MKFKIAASAALVFGIFYCGCEIEPGVAKFTQPDASLKEIRIAEADSNGVELVFVIKVDNPYCVSLPLTNLDYKLTIGRHRQLSGNTDVEAKVLPDKSDVIEISVWVETTEFADYKPGEKIAYKADVGLTADTPVVGLVRLPLEKAASIEMPVKN